MSDGNFTYGSWRKDSASRFYRFAYTSGICSERSCFHARVLNSRALEISKIDRDTPDIPEGIIQRDEDGEPTGALYEAAHWHVEKFRNPVTHEDRIRSIAGLTHRFASLGITGVTEVMGMPYDYEMYMDAKKAGFRQPCDSLGSTRRRIYVSQGSGNKKSAWGAGHKSGREHIC